MKKVGILLLLSILATSCLQKSSHNLEWISFSWVSDSVSGKYIEKLAIRIPVIIDDLPYRFTMQLDLGAVTTEFYGKTLKPFIDKYPSLNNKLDTTKVFLTQGQENQMFRNVNLQLGDVVFRDVDVGLFTNYGQEHTLSETEIHIGTIAPDLFQDQILIIDYKLNRLAVTDKLPLKYNNVSFVEFEIRAGRIKIPFQINGNIEYLMFDTGASIFSLVTTKRNALAIGETEIIDSLKVSSWGKYITFYGLKTIKPIMLGKDTLRNSVVYYDEEASFDDFYLTENIWGITGNAFFFENVVIIDYKNNRFGVK